jgi:glycogen synthase
MRVLMTSDTVGGVWTYALELARAMFSEQFILATVGGGPVSASQLREVPANVRLVTGATRLDQTDAPGADAARTAEWLLEIERRESPDLIHLNGYAHGALPFRAPKLVVGHSCALSWSKAVHADYDAGLWEHYRAAVTAGLRGADFVVANSMAMLDELHRHYDFDTPARVIYNGLSVQSPAIRSTRGGPSAVLAIGERSDAARNIQAVIDAIPLIQAPVTINETLSRGAMTEAIEGASIFLSPALYDPFGESVLEAAQSACALVLADIPSYREMWRDAALYAPPRSADAIAQQVNKLLANPFLRDEMAHRARQRAGDFAPQRMASDYQMLYRLLNVETLRLRVKSPSSNEVGNDTIAAGRRNSKRTDGYKSADSETDGFWR